jgi:hypothetical protein
MHHLLRHCKTADTILTSVHYDYGVPNKDIVTLLRAQIDGMFLHKRLPLSIARKCGVDVSTLILVGHSISTLVYYHNYLFEDVLLDLQLTWPLLLKLEFSPEMLTVTTHYSAVALYDLLDVRAQQLFDFYRNGDQIGACLGIEGSQLFDIRREVWVV